MRFISFSGKSVWGRAGSAVIRISPKLLGGITFFMERNVAHFTCSFGGVGSISKFIGRR